MAWVDYFKKVGEQLAMLIAGTTEGGSALPGRDASGHYQVDVLSGAGGGGLTNTELRASDVNVSLDGEVVTVGSADSVVTVTPTLDTSAYASGDLLFDSTEVANAVRAAGGTAILQSITIIDKGDQGVAMTLLIANAATDFGTLNAAPDPDDAEAATVIGWVPVATSDYVDLGGARVACVRNVGLVLKAAGGATSVWVAAVNGTGTPTYANGDLVVQVGLLRS